MWRYLFLTVVLLTKCGIQPVLAEDAQEIFAFAEPWADIELAASEMGILARMDVKEGDVVEAGQVVASLDDSVLQASLQVAKANKAAQGSLKSAMADLEARETDIEKVKGLRRREHASQKELDHVALELRMAKARVQAVHEELEVKRLEYARIQAQLSRRRIRSTIDGVVTEIYRDEGEFVSPSHPTVVRVVKLDPLRVEFSVPVQRRDELITGQTVALEIGVTKQAAQARVEFVSPTVEGGTDKFRVIVRLPNPDGRWQAGEKTVLMLNGVPTEIPQILARRPR